MEDLKHTTNRWEVSIIELKMKDGIKYKVTRRIAELSVAETKFFNSLN